ncbi:MAG: hypothetical protein ICCCNLDF_03700 [Planctomycetes bacterium]|nr:hypothetical protein [Planctomycetota bacterium]
MSVDTQHQAVIDALDRSIGPWRLCVMVTDGREVTEPMGLVVGGLPVIGATLGALLKGLPSYLEPACKIAEAARLVAAQDGEPEVLAWRWFLVAVPEASPLDLIDLVGLVPGVPAGECRGN